MKIVATFIENYKGQYKAWDCSKQFLVEESEILTDHVGDENTHWWKGKRIVLFHSWKERIVKNILELLIDSDGNNAVGESNIKDVCILISRTFLDN